MKVKLCYWSPKDIFHSTCLRLTLVKGVVVGVQKWVPPHTHSNGLFRKLLAGWLRCWTWPRCHSGETQHPAQRGSTDPGTRRAGAGWGRGSREQGPLWDTECISNPSVSVSSLSGDIITIAAAHSSGRAGAGRERRWEPCIPLLLLLLPQQLCWSRDTLTNLHQYPSLKTVPLARSEGQLSATKAKTMQTNRIPVFVSCIFTSVGEQTMHQ